MRALIKGDEIILINNLTDPFVSKHLKWMESQGYTLIENWRPLSADGEVTETVVETVEETVEETAEETADDSVIATSGTSSLGSDDSVIIINGKTYTKAELKKLLE